MRSAGDIMNDFADRQLDKHIERTRNRPLTTGRVSPREAIVLAIVLCLLAFGLVLLLNPLCIELSFVALGLALIYPYAKRFTMMPQFILGLAYNWGVIMAFAAVENQLSVLAWVVYGSVVIWTIAHDTFYAMADLPDDIRMGVKSSARLFGSRCHHAIGILQAITWILWWSVGQWQGLGAGYDLALLLILPLLVYQHYLASGGTITAYIRAFNHNHWVGLLWWLGVVWSMI